MGRLKLASRKKPLSPSGRNERLTDLNGPEKREEANPWTVYRKVRMGHSRPKIMQVKKVRG